MKLAATVLALLSVSNVASADCAVLDYAEMKDMSLGEMTKEYCKAAAKGASYFAEQRRKSDLAAQLVAAAGDDAIKRREAALVDEASAKDGEAYEQCQSQKARMARVIEQKGIIVNINKGACPTPKNP